MRLSIFICFRYGTEAAVELRHIRYFLAVAEEGSFTKAALRVGIGQPPLSLQIKDLEAEVGTQLFHRTAHGAELTEAGEAFRAVVAPMPGQAASAIRAAQRAARGETGALALGSIGSGVVNPLVSSAIRGFRRSFPEVELRLEEASSGVLAAHVRDGRLAAAILRPNRGDSGDLRLYTLAEDALLAVLPSGHRLAEGGGGVALADLAEETILITAREIGAGLYDTVAGACRAAGFEPRFDESAPQIATLLALVAAEFGVSILPASMRRFVVPGVEFRELSGEPASLSLSLAIRRDERSPLVANFVRHARVAARAERAARAAKA